MNSQSFNFFFHQGLPDARQYRITIISLALLDVFLQGEVWILFARPSFSWPAHVHHIYTGHHGCICTDRKSHLVIATSKIFLAAAGEQVLSFCKKMRKTCEQEFA